jgi:hypothetical protein
VNARGRDNYKYRPRRVATNMGLSRLTLLGFALLAWSGVIAIVALDVDDSKFSVLLNVAAAAAATAGLATAIVGAARHETD